MSKKELTDRQLASLYYEIACHFDECKRLEPHRSTQDIYSEILTNLIYSLNCRESSLSALNLAGNQVEVDKVFEIARTFIQSRSDTPRPLVKAADYSYQRKTYCKITAGSFSWHDLKVLHHLNYCETLSPYHAQIDQNQWSFNHTLSRFFLLTLAVISGIIFFLSLYYLINTLLTNIDTMAHSEGWLCPTLSFLSMTAGSLAGGFLSVCLLSSPLMSVAFVLGCNCFFLMGATVSCAAILGGALLCFITKEIQALCSPKINASALDPFDPCRYILTPAEEQQLNRLKLDPVKVKCAIVALRAEIGEGGVPSFLYRLSTHKGQAIQDSLNQIRKLRKGEIQSIIVGQRVFNCMRDTSSPKPDVIRERRVVDVPLLLIPSAPSQPVAATYHA